KTPSIWRAIPGVRWAGEPSSKPTAWRKPTRLLSNPHPQPQATTTMPQTLSDILADISPIPSTHPLISNYQITVLALAEQAAHTLVVAIPQINLYALTPEELGMLHSHIAAASDILQCYQAKINDIAAAYRAAHPTTTTKP